MSTRTSTCNSRLIFLCLWLSVSAQARNPPLSSPNTRLVNQILSYVDESVSACVDYYKYACGKWPQNHVNDSFLEITGLIDQKVNEDLVQLMAEKWQQRPLEPTSVEAKVLSFYQTCREASQSTRSGRHYLELMPPNEHIPWPQFKRKSENWGSSKFQWLETLARLRRFGLNNVLFNLEMGPHLLNSSKNIVGISMPNFDQNNQRLSGSLITRLTLRFLGFSHRKALILARQVINLETNVRELAEKMLEQESDISEDLNLRQLELQTGGQWRKYLETLLGHIVPSEYMLQADNVAYLTALVKLINEWDREELATYIMLRFVAHLKEDSMDGKEPIECIQNARNKMELAVNLLYEQRFISADKLRQHQADVSELFEQLRKQFLKKLDENYLKLASSDLEMLRAKLLDVTINIGNMPKVADRSSFVKRFYADLQLIDNRDYAANHLRLLEFQTRRQLEQLNQPLKGTDYFVISDGTSGMSSTPYYMMRTNVIIVPYGILQEPIFHHDAHDIFKLSLLGFMLSHEVMHGFVSSGLIYDYRGNYNEKGTQIVVDSKYTSGVICLNNDDTDYMSEREADIAGIRLAYDAYFGPGSKFNQTLPDFTNLPLKQLFFLNLAQFFCGNTAPIDFEDHDSDEMRLRQVLINFPAFAEAHGCRQDHDNMHPAQKCRLW